MHSNPLRHRLATSRYFTAPFNKALLSPSRKRVCSNVHLQQFAALSELYTPQLAAAPLGKSALITHCLTLTSPGLYASLSLLLQHSTTCLSFALLHVQAARLCYNWTLLRGLTQHLSATLLFSFRTSLLSPALTVNIAQANLRSSTTTTTTTPFGNAAPPTNRSSAITSVYEFCASLPPPETAPVH